MSHAAVSALSPLDDSIVVEAVTLVRAGGRLFDGLSLTLSERRIGLIGENGSGKSTLLRLANSSWRYRRPPAGHLDP